jgi:beta-alanine degradation protein BauB
MKRAAFFSLFAAATALGRPSSGPERPVPVRDEPMHHRKLENAYVRVFDVTVPPRGRTLFHVHALDYVFVTLGSSHVRSERADGASVELTLADGETRFTAAPLVHRAVNLSDAPFRNLTIEIVQRGGSPPEPPLPAMPGHSVVFENDRVRIDRQTLEPGQSTGIHTHTLRSLGVCVSPARVEYSEPGGKSETADLAVGQFSWHEGPRTHALKNVGTTRFEAVEIEWK